MRKEEAIPVINLVKTGTNIENYMEVDELEMIERGQDEITR